MLAGYKRIRLTRDEFARLCREFGEHTIDEYLARLDSWLQSKGKDPYPDHYAALVQWLERDGLRPLSLTGSLCMVSSKVSSGWLSADCTVSSRSAS